MHRFHVPLARLPVLIGGLILLIPWFYLTWNTTVGELVPRIRFRTKQTVAGVVQDAAPDLSLHALVTGSYQRSVSLAVGMLSPVFKPAVHWKNQLYYTLLGTSGTDKVIVGPGRQLLQIPYLREYCARDLAAFRPQAEAWAADLRKLQDAVEARGQTFLYLVTPSKVAQNPEVLPPGYACPATPEARAGKLPLYAELLRRHGVHFVDSASLMPAARERFGIGMFPRGGIHWNALGSAVATQAVIAAINAQGRAPPLTTFDFTWEVSYKPSGSDRDLLDIMNLPYPDAHYPVPVLTLRSTPPPGACRPVRIAEVGGSFLAEIDETMTRLACAPDITYWFYWDHRRIRYAAGRSHSGEAEAEARRRSLAEADIILLEENEAGLPATDHARALMEAVRTLPAH